MTPAKRREIARMGGKAAHAKGVAHEYTQEEARRAGREGGIAVSKDREHMRAIGRKGGSAKKKRARGVLATIADAVGLGDE